MPVYDCESFCLRERVCIHSETHVCQFGTLLYLAGHQNPQLDMPEDSKVSWCTSCQHVYATQLSIVTSMFGRTRYGKSASPISLFSFDGLNAQL